jgi:cation:H+ antiporter
MSSPVAGPAARVGKTFDPNAERSSARDRVRLRPLRRVVGSGRSHRGREVPGVTVVHVLLMVGCAAAIYLACDWFVNAIEWLGVELRLATVAIGTVLAAIGTALPESVVTLVAVLSGGGGEPGSGKEIGVGAALGGPLVLSTVAYAVVGVLLLRQRGRSAAVDRFADVDRSRLVLDQTAFLLVAGAGLLLGLVAFVGKQWLGLVFFAAYAVYVRRELGSEEPGHSSDGLEPLRLWRVRRPDWPPRWAIVVQTVGALVVVVVASQLFVGQLEWAGPRLGLAPAVVALLLSPIATELPEIMNAVIWARQGKTRLALANISGSMMVQATVPAGIGLLFTPWHFEPVLVSASLATLAAVLYLSTVVRAGRLRPGWLAGTATFYLAFAVALGVLLS